MKPEQTVLRPLAGRSGRDPREVNFSPPDPWSQMFEEQRELMLREPERGFAGLRPLLLALIAVALVLASAGVVLLHGW